MPFPGILGGFETRQKQFFAYFWSQEKNKKKKFFQEKSIFIGKNRFLSEKSAIFLRFFFFRFFHPNIFSSTTEIRFFSEKSVEIGDFFFPCLHIKHEVNIQHGINMETDIVRHRDLPRQPPEGIESEPHQRAALSTSQGQNP